MEYEQTCVENVSIESDEITNSNMASDVVSHLDTESHDRALINKLKEIVDLLKLDDPLYVPTVSFPVENEKYSNYGCRGRVIIPVKSIMAVVLVPTEKDGEDLNAPQYSPDEHGEFHYNVILSNGYEFETRSKLNVEDFEQFVFDYNGYSEARKKRKEQRRLARQQKKEQQDQTIDASTSEDEMTGIEVDERGIPKSFYLL